MSWLKWVGVAAAALLLVGGALKIYGSWHWERLTAELNGRLEVGRSTQARAPFDLGELTGLPAPVQRFFQACLTEGMARISAVSIQHTGTFNMSETGEQWKQFTSSQRVVTRRPGFVWDGRIAMMPGLAAYVHDAYVEGEGILHPAIGGLFSLADMRGRGDIAEGELMRFFAEAAWYPTLLLPGDDVSWQAIDENQARATLKDGAISVSLDFTFGADGLVESVRAQARGRTVKGSVVPTPWEGRWFDYQFVSGMRVPMRGEVAWLLPEGRKPYWRGQITGLKYEFAK